MGDDVCAPNLKRFEYASESFTEEDIRNCITNYFTSNLRHFKWYGFCNGEYIVSADCMGDDKNYKVVIELADNWKNLLDDSRVIYFDHHSEEDHRSGVKYSKYYTLKRAEEIYDEYFNHKMK